MVRKKIVKIALVVSDFNASVSHALHRRTEKALIGAGVQRNSIRTFHVPGAFELPWACQRLAQTKKWNAVIALGAVIRGETPHFDYVAFGAALGIMKANLSSPAPIIFGVLTTENTAQAKARIRKGAEFARGALQMIDLKSSI